MTFGYYDYKLTRPPKGLFMHRTLWQEYLEHKKAIQSWCNEQKFDHWGYVERKDENEDIFWFNIEEDYAFFLLRWA